MALVAAAAFYVIIKKTKWGFELLGIGGNQTASYAAGINVSRQIILAATVSGGIAGLAGVGQVAGIVFHMTYDISPGFGYTGVVIAMVGGLSPIGVVLASFLMAVVVQGNASDASRYWSSLGSGRDNSGHNTPLSPGGSILHEIPFEEVRLECPCLMSP